MWRCAAAILFLASLSGVGMAAEPVKPLDACSLLSAADVMSVTGGRIPKSERNDSGQVKQGGYSSTCIWKVEGLPKLDDKEGAPFGGTPFAMLNTIVWPAGSGLALKYVNDFRDAATQDLIPSKPVAIPGLGEDALFWGDGVAVAKGNVSFGISVHLGTDKRTEQSLEEALARKIVPKL